jgi:hypothetical protein
MFFSRFLFSWCSYILDALNLECSHPGRLPALIWVRTAIWTSILRDRHALIDLSDLNQFWTASVRHWLVLKNDTNSALTPILTPTRKSQWLSSTPRSGMTGKVSVICQKQDLFLSAPKFAVVGASANPAENGYKVGNPRPSNVIRS